MIPAFQIGLVLLFVLTAWDEFTQRTPSNVWLTCIRWAKMGLCVLGLATVHDMRIDPWDVAFVWVWVARLTEKCIAMYAGRTNPVFGDSRYIHSDFQDTVGQK